jgi:osmotically-inducible protein OsmY
MVLQLGLIGMPLSAQIDELNDQSITDAIEDELSFDQAVPSHMIDVVTNDGVVTLEGRVDNLLATERAAGLARTVKGVRSVVNRIEVESTLLRTDSAIRFDVERALLLDPATESYQVDVVVDDGVVTLRGTVDSWQEQEFAAMVAKGVNGVTELRNRLDVRYSFERSDDEILWDVEQALRWDALIDHALINVSVSDGVVELSGFVGSAAERSRTAGKAWIAGVRDVVASELTVARWARDDDLREDKYVIKPDESVEKAIIDALQYDPRVVSNNVRAEVTGGIVTLRGTVDNLRAKRAAARDARNTVGVLALKNRLKVRPSEIWSDSAIAHGISAALLRDPYFGNNEIGVTVNDGVANLYGSVDSYFEKGHADELASTARGVVDVNNQLTVRRGDPLVYEPYLGDYDFYRYDWYDYDPHPTFINDDRIREKIETELFWSPFVDAEDLVVTVEDGVATLSGTVDSRFEMHAAVESAYEGGAIWVDNGIEVR